MIRVAALSGFLSHANYQQFLPAIAKDQILVRCLEGPQLLRPRCAKRRRYGGRAAGRAGARRASHQVFDALVVVGQQLSHQQLRCLRNRRYVLGAVLSWPGLGECCATLQEPVLSTGECHSDNIAIQCSP